MDTSIINGVILTPWEEIRGYDLWIGESQFLRFAPPAPPVAGVNRLDARGYYVVPGLIDLHTHGANGHDTMDATPRALQEMGRFFAQHGVTSYLPTTLAAPADATAAAIRNAVSTPPPADGARHLGVHLEGPYLGLEYRGAQPPAQLRPADPAEYRQWIEVPQVRLITVAPEVPGVLSLIDAGVERSIEFALGHTSASYEQVLEAVDHGLRQVTHTFNGMAPLHHRTPGALGCALGDDRIYCQVIPDGVHVHPSVVKVLIRAKGTERTILVTDSMRATGLSDGDYPLGDQQIHVRHGVARTDAGGLAGSTLTLDQGLRNVMHFGDLSLREALPMATTTPAAAMGWEGKKGTIAPLADADLVILDDAYRVRLTMVGGQVVFDALH